MACAISHVPVGVDIEQEAEADLDFAQKFFHPEETSRINSSENIRDSFYRHWALKESYLKCLGTGLSVPLNSFCADVSTNPPQIMRDGKRLPFVLQSWKISDYQLAVCCRTNSSLLHCVPKKADIQDCFDVIG